MQPAHRARSFYLILPSAPQLADPLGHGAHGAECTPGPGLEQGHDDQADQQGGQHQAVEPKAELSRPIRDQARRIGPAPGDPEGPEELDRLTEGGRAGAHQPGLEQHVPKHGQEEGQESVPEPLGVHPGGRGLVAGTLQAAAQLHAQLAPAAQVVAEPLVAAEDGEAQGRQKVDHPQPGEQDVEKSQGKIDDRPDPEIVVPALLLFHRSSVLSASAIQPAGQALAHRPQPTQVPASISAQHPSGIFAAPLGHAEAQVPQATQTARSTLAYRFAIRPSPTRSASAPGPPCG